VNIILADSPWYPLAVAAALHRSRKLGVTAVPYPEWLRWRLFFQVRGIGFVETPGALEVVQGVIAALVITPEKAAA